MSAGIEALAAVRETVSPVLLANRLKKLSPSEFKRFEEAAGLSKSGTRWLRQGSRRPEQVEFVNQKLEELLKRGDTHRTVSLKVLADAFEAKFGFRRAPSTIQRMLVLGMAPKPRAPR